MTGMSTARLRGSAPVWALAALAVLTVLALLTPVRASEPGAGARPTAVAVAGETRPSTRPNIVVVMADDMRYDDLRFAPHVRRLLGRGGVEFRNAFASYPLCCPARASFLTGVHAHNHHVYSHRPPYGFAAFDDSRTLATTLRRAGYRTGFVGKYLNGYGAQRSRVTGRPSYTYVPPGWDAWAGAVERPGPRATPGGTYDYYRTVYNIDGTPSGRRFHGEYQTDTLGRLARGMVDRWSGGRAPFFLYLSFVAPHHGGPGEPDDPRDRRRAGRLFEYKTPARPDRVEGRFDHVRRAPGVPASGPTDASVADLPPFLRRVELDARDRANLAEVTRQRAEAVHVLDQQVGRLARRLRATGELDDTVLVFTSDNGYFLGEHRMRGGKIYAHEPSLRVPFLVAGPDVPAGERRYTPVTTVDQAATVLDLAGVLEDHPLPVDGRSVVPALAEDRAWDEAVLDEALLPGLARRSPDFRDARRSIGVRTARWSLIRYATGHGELYDLARDPDQLRNRYTVPRFAQVRRRLEQVWDRAAYCSGSGCRVDLPADLAATPAQARRLTERWYATVRRGR